ncbi:MAG TPA: hypothetical protein VNT28_08890 [Candidatus Limnocylindrales bacterium]|jgi:hypothetical protein|nr:hypothetical protein [Candidatus Limnocylindrales bacterium]
MDEQNRDDFYEGPPLEDEARWHDGAVVAEDGTHAGERQPLDRPLTEVELPEGGAYPPQELVERPHQPSGGLRQNELTRDPSLSRAVDRADDGLSPEAAGYDRTADGPSPGSLAPDAEQQPADAADEPSGSWGSSG